MNLTILMSYVYGYVDIEVEGYYIERFINICKKRNITISEKKLLQIHTKYAIIANAISRCGSVW